MFQPIPAVVTAKLALKKHNFNLVACHIRHDFQSKTIALHQGQEHLTLDSEDQHVRYGSALPVLV